jgi:NAD(P)-dependent dehydrogenase (short-subunit alcohol dehydrogenase family)
MARLDGRVAILTGGAKGIGRHYARALAAEGARLMIADIADGKEVAAALAREHGANSVESSVTDVSDEAAVKALVAKTMERFGKIDILVNNAALFAPLQETKCTDIDVGLWDRVMAIKSLAPGFTMSETVLAENPGHVETARSRAVAARALKRDEHPQDLLGALVFLASADSDFITGQTIAVDGGNVNT